MNKNNNIYFLCKCKSQNIKPIINENIDAEMEALKIRFKKSFKNVLKMSSKEIKRNIMSWEKANR